MAFILFLRGNVSFCLLLHVTRNFCPAIRIYPPFPPWQQSRSQAPSSPARDGVTQDSLPLNVALELNLGPWDVSESWSCRSSPIEELSQLPWTLFPLSRSCNMGLPATQPWPYKWGPFLGGWQNPKGIAVWVSKCLPGVKQPAIPCCLLGPVTWKKNKILSFFCHCYLGSFC